MLFVMFKNPYGTFSADGSCYIIHRPDTPRPWVNFLTNGEYLALCSHRGGGFSCFLDHRFNSVLRRGQHIHNEDMPGRFFYLKDEETGQIWSTAGHPLAAPLDHFEARHSAGFTHIDSSSFGIFAKQRFFVPHGHNAEIWSLDLHNLSGRARRLSVVAYGEPMLGNWFIDVNEPVFASLFNQVRVENGAIIYQKQWWNAKAHWDEHNERWPYRVVASAYPRPARMTANRDAFIGPFRSLKDPAGLLDDELAEVAASGADLCVAMQWRMTLEPGAAWSAHLVIGIEPDRGDSGTPSHTVALCEPKNVARLVEETRDWWRGLFEGLEVETPDDEINLMFNNWNKIQLMANFFFGRAPSYFHKQQYPSVRDQCQDTFGVNVLNPELAREKILHIARFFYSDGRAGAGCNRIGLPEGPSIKVDVPLWLVLMVGDYIRQTGDWAVLEEDLPLLDGGSSTIYEKLKRAMERIAVDKGPHGLPLIGRGDWNDAADQIGAKGRGESVWLAQFLCFAVRNAAFIFEHEGDLELLARYRDFAARQEAIIREQCWDGQWFIRAFKDDGSPVGARGPAEGFIWINSQTWAVLAGVGTDEQRHACMDSVIRHLETEDGLMNLAPAYTQPDSTIGIITAFKPGWKENAAVFSHASAFNVCARAELGRGADALTLYKKLLPVNRDADRYLGEPYAYAQFVAGPGAGHEAGRAAWHWLTGTAAWMIRAMTDYICGVRAEVEGLRICPAVDPSWKSFKLVRMFRGARYEIQFHNPDGVETGVRSIILDGRRLDGELVPPPTAKIHRIEVIMGAANLERQDAASVKRSSVLSVAAAAEVP